MVLEKVGMLGGTAPLQGMERDGGGVRVRVRARVRVRVRTAFIWVGRGRGVNEVSLTRTRRSGFGRKKSGLGACRRMGGGREGAVSGEYGRLWRFRLALCVEQTERDVENRLLLPSGP